MKTLLNKKHVIPFIAVVLCIVISAANAQNIFPSSGRAGIYTTSPLASLQVKGGARIGTAANYLNIDSATGQLSFAGTGAYQVAGNKYAFQYSGNPNYGLFFNSTAVQYEFRNGSAVPVFSINANTGNGVFNGTIKVGAYTLPATDGTNGQVLKTNGTGALTWGADNNTTYAAGTGLSLSGTTFTNTAPDQTVTLNNGSGISITGSYPNFTIASTGLNANQALSNLTATAINQSLVPNSTSVFRLGQRTLRWDSAYLNGIVFGNGTIQSTAFTPYTPGTGISIVANAIINSSPDKIVALTAGTGISVTGTYPNFTVTNTASSGGGWSLTGNAGTDPNTNFIGTTDTKPLVFEIANTKSGIIDFTLGNTSLGYASLASNSTGNSNTAEGYDALYANSTGHDNTANGGSALFKNTIGSSNTASGAGALYNNTDGYSNVALGKFALYSNTNAHNLVAIGDSALFNQSSILESGEFPVYGDNTGVGSKALYNNTHGARNTAVGSLALYNVQGGYGQASYNTAIGFGSLFNNVSGSEITVCGSLADVSSSSLFNSTALGYNAITTANNQVMLGNTFVTSVMAAGSITIVSDGRFKKNIKENVPGLAFINQLKPVTYNYDIHGLNNLIAPANASGKKAENSDMQKRDEAAIAAKEKIVYTGFVAQDVSVAAKKLNYDFSGVHRPQNDKDPYALSYSDFVVPLVKAVQELSKMNDVKDAKIDTLQNQLNELRTLVFSIRQQQQSCNPCNSSVSQQTQSYSTILTDASSLQQNVPNPFNHTTIINYSLPQKFTNAQIIITDRTGQTLKAVNISVSGKGSLNVDAATLASGAYHYSLVIDGKLIATKQMVLAR